MDMFEILEKAAKEAAKIIVPLYKTNLDIKMKSDSTDFVTEADVKSQEAIVKSLT